MSVFAIALVKDEQDIIARTVAQMLDQVDRIIVSDNGSTDATKAILEACDRVTVLDDPDPAYYQSQKMSRLAATAREQGAEWIVPFDADEMWRSRERRIADDLQALDAGILVAQAVLFDHVSTSEDPQTTDPVERMQWRRLAPTPFRKVACRARRGLVIEQGNHSARYPGVNHPATAVDLFEVRHFPVRSPEQWVRKAKNGAAAYAATSLPDAMGAHWRDWGRLIDKHGEQTLADGFYEHYWFDRPAEHPHLVFDPCR